MAADIALREFHVSRQARDRYQFEETLFATNGNVIFANFHATRIFAQRMNERRDLLNFPEQAARAGQLNAMGLIDEIFHYVLNLYRRQNNPHILEEALDFLEAQLSAEAVDATLRAFVDAFPPVAVYRRELSAADYLAGETAGVPHRQVALEEMLMLWLANVNPAFTSFQELFDDSDLEKLTAYPKIMELLPMFFQGQPFFGPDRECLVTMLRRPAIEVPHSIQGQLDYIRTRWLALLDEYLYRLLSSLDLLAEEGKQFFGFGPGPAQVYDFSSAATAAEPENFSPDRDWMPRLIMMAKNAYVWLDQLSRQYEQPITRLDQVPDAELDKLARMGFTGLWLIGLWQRSEASKRIKQIMGNPEAVASAYSLAEYRIADDLGGEEAFAQLKARAWQRGIRMASDMVPNHMGIDSRWVIEHPQWFVGLDYPPFPTYSYNSTNLSNDGRVGVYLEDHYYSRSDAAVTFKRVDHWTGATRYIYHGNDGTSMPWNDTAQLDYLNPEVREAVIQTILQVARRSPIIRFDAAMTLAKRHYQRLWFPEPGSGGDIPSRAGFGLTKAQFDAAMPEEFWREVVERVAQEAPDTLLLAEAFWMMEGYFVRTLGMHRVYNSAFMHMLRDEKNDEYRQLIKNTLEFDPQILKRYVNFMNNPDERTAIDQFGKGDKYFGICSVMVTMPGLPMFGHGQIEGYAEKYGMEFRRAYWDESADPWLVERHERQISPLLHKRALFAEVDNFLLYDFYTPDGRVDENVFAYSNMAGTERSLVLYHNRYADTRGWIRTSAAYAVKGPDGEKVLVQRTLAAGLNLTNDPDVYLIFRDAVSGLEYIRNGKQLVEQGMYADLHAYEVQVFVNFREVHDNEWRHYGQLHTYLNGRGVPAIEEAMQELFLAPVHLPYRMLVSGPAFRWLMGARVSGAPADADTLAQVESKMRDLLSAAAYVVGKTADDAEPTSLPDADWEALAQEVRDRLAIVLTLPDFMQQQLAACAPPVPEETTRRYQAAVAYLRNCLREEDVAAWGTLLGWLFTCTLGKVADPDAVAAAELSDSWVDEWLLGKLIANAMRDLSQTADVAWRAVAAIKLMINYRRWLSEVPLQSGQDYRLLATALREPAIQSYLGVNRYRGILWFNKESFEQLLGWMMLSGMVELGAAPTTTPETFVAAVLSFHALVERLLVAEAASEYQIARLLDALKDQETPPLVVDATA